MKVRRPIKFKGFIKRARVHMRKGFRSETLGEILCKNRTFSTIVGDRIL